MIQRHFRFQRHGADQRIQVVYALDLGQRAICRSTVADHGHRPEFNDLGHLGGLGINPGAFFLRGKPIGEIKLGRAAEQGRPFALQPPFDGRAHGPHSGNRGHPKGKTRQKQSKPPQATAHFTAGKAAR